MEEFRARRAAIKAALGRLEQMTRRASWLRKCWRRFASCTASACDTSNIAATATTSHAALVRDRDALEYQLIAAEREHINATYRNGELKDDARRRVEREFDLREAHLASVRRSRNPDSGSSETWEQCQTSRSRRSGARRGEQILQRLRERPPTLWYQGQQIKDVTTHPALRGGVADPGEAV